VRLDAYWRYFKPPILALFYIAAHIKNSGNNEFKLIDQCYKISLVLKTVRTILPLILLLKLHVVLVRKFVSHLIEKCRKSLIIQNMQPNSTNNSKTTESVNHLDMCKKQE